MQQRKQQQAVLGFRGSEHASSSPGESFLTLSDASEVIRATGGEGRGRARQGCLALLRSCPCALHRLLVICAARGTVPTLYRFPWQRRPGETRTMLQDVVSGVSGALRKLVRSTGEGGGPGVSAAAGGSGFAAQAARCGLGRSLGGPLAGVERPGKSERFGPPCWLPGRRGRCCRRRGRCCRRRHRLRRALPPASITVLQRCSDPARPCCVAGKAGWIAGTTFLILIVPLIIEMDREQQARPATQRRTVSLAATRHAGPSRCHVLREDQQFCVAPQPCWGPAS